MTERFRIALLILITGMLPQLIPAQVTFTDVSQSVGVDHLYMATMKMGGGVAWFDYNADGWEDIYLTGGMVMDRLYENNGDGTFTDVSLAAGLGFTDSVLTSGVITGDLDNDGYREVFLTTEPGIPNVLLRNNGDGTFTDISVSSGISADTTWSTSASFGDMDLDGLLDIYVVNYVKDAVILEDSLGEPIGFAHHCYPNYLYINQGGLTFLESASAYMAADTGCGLALGITDYDNDHDMDVLIANDFGMWVEPNRLLRNEYPTAAFSDVSVASAMDYQLYGMGVAAGDIDHDQDLDYYITNMGRNRLGRNNGDGTFTDIADAAGVANTFVDTTYTTGWGTAFLDFDLDSWPDLFVANGHITMIQSILHNSLRDPDKLYRNLGNNTFEDVSLSAGVGDSAIARGAAVADYDGDGDPDILNVLIHWDTLSTDRVRLYRNDQATGNHYLEVRVQGTLNNRDGFGTHLLLAAGGEKWIQEIDGGSSHLSQNSSVAHFGLGSATTIDSLWVIWPGGAGQVLYGLPADTTILVVEDSAQFVALPEPAAPLALRLFPNPNEGDFALEWQQAAAGDLSFELYDVQGRLLQTPVNTCREAGAQRLRMNLKSDLPPGLYFYRFLAAGQVATGKLMVR